MRSCRAGGGEQAKTVAARWSVGHDDADSLAIMQVVHQVADAGARTTLVLARDESHVGIRTAFRGDGKRVLVAVVVWAGASTGATSLTALPRAHAGPGTVEAQHGRLPLPLRRFDVRCRLGVPRTPHDYDAWFARLARCGPNHGAHWVHGATAGVKASSMPRNRRRPEWQDCPPATVLASIVILRPKDHAPW